MPQARSFAIAMPLRRLRDAAPLRFFRRAADRYVAFSTEKPYVCSTITAGTLLFCADVTAQSLTAKTGDGIDWRRTGALAIWGMFYYGFPLKWIYFCYDRYLGTGRVLTKIFIDVYINAPIFMLPTFYFGTGLLKGRQSVSEIAQQFREEWFEASFGTALWWTPVQYVNFRYVPQHSRILAVVSASFVHKTWLSWLSNRKTAQEEVAAAAASQAATSAPSAQGVEDEPAMREAT